MQTTINQILEGNFNYDNRYLDFSCTKLEISLNRDRVYESSFRVIGPQGAYTSGRVESTDRRMECLTKKFTGSNEEIFFRFHGEEMEEGDVVCGSFRIVSNQGEYNLPFSVSRESVKLTTSVGDVSNLSHFATLARNNWHEAVALFYTPEFKRVFADSDRVWYDAYRAFSAGSGSEQNVEEFLIHINKKTKTEYLIQESQLYIEMTSEGAPVTEHEITIVRNGWGYTGLNVDCEGDFLFTEKESLSDDDFLGNSCKLPVYIDTEALHGGNNFGKIILSNSFVKIELPVKVKTGFGLATKNNHLFRKKSILSLMRLYQEFRAKRTDAQEWIKESARIVERLVAMDEKDLAARLFQVQLLITEDRTEEAGWILDHVADLLQKGDGDETLLAYYFYLTTLLHRENDYVNRVTAEVEHIYRKDNANWRAAWLLLFLSDEYHKSPTGKWVFLENQFHIGCMSPLLYIEAVSLLNNNPALLRRLGAFEQQTIWYGIRTNILKKEVIEQFLYQAERVKEYSYTLFRSLNRLYEANKDDSILQLICNLLIKGGKVGEEYFRFYRDGVEQNLHITNLYEFYMMSIDMDRYREIPKRILMYFAYQNELDYEHTAYMYDYIIQNEESMKDIFLSYKEKIEHFCLEQISRLHLNKSLAHIYNRFLQPAMLTDQTCGALSRILFAHAITVKDENIKKVYVYQPGNLYPEEYVLNDGKTWVSLYGSNYTLVFEDIWENRFSKSVEYSMVRLMLPGKFLQQLEQFAPDNAQLDLYFLEDKADEALTSQNDVARALRVASSAYADKKVRHKWMLKILLYYYEMDAYASLDEYLAKVPVREFAPKERGEVIQFMILRDKTDIAGKLIAEYGPYYIDTKLLVRLLDALMDANGMGEDRILLDTALYAFRKGRYDSTILYYLCRYYKGTTKEARDIWKASQSYQLDTHRICEFLLIQMLYTGAFIHEKMEVFRSYVKNGGDSKVKSAVLAQCAHEYYLKDKPTENVVFDQIHHMLSAGEHLNRICKIAFLKYYSENTQEITEETGATINLLLQELINQGIYLEFFKVYDGNSQVYSEMSDKVVLEYHGDPKKKIMVHFCFVADGQEPGECITESLREIAGGVYFKEFILFAGEMVEYYLTEEGLIDPEEGTDLVIESGTLTKDTVESGQSRYRLINEIVASAEMQEYEKMDNLLEKYYKREYLNSKLFTLK
ncbi:MAG: DUF5717 family protein [Acetatifactor sp.]|nr:DUF5717 family protein [Acetatifactor sp.]